VGTAATILGMYDALSAALGPSRWWPGETPFEVAIGAILTQNTNWTNVEKAIANLKDAGALTVSGLRAVPLDKLEALIRPTGYFRQKSSRLHLFLDFLEQQSAGSVEDLAQLSLEELRTGLLSVRGIGPETADSILLYALNKPTFVVDTYTVRMFSRHGVLPEETNYHEVRELFMDSLPDDVALYNEYHALIVRAGKEWCRKTGPKCQECPLRPFLPDPERLPA
jgi:endonuclease III related protein